MIICVKCGHHNPDGLNQCEQCGAQLPRLVSAGPREPEPDYIDDRVKELEDAANRVVSGEWSTDQFGEFVDDIMRKLSEREQAIRSIEIPPEAIEDFREELECGFQGITLFYEGVNRMSQYLEALDVTCLEEGLEIVKHGNDQINEAMKINRANRQKFEEMYLDSSTMM